LAYKYYLTTRHKVRTKPSEKRNRWEEIVRNITDGEQAVIDDR
jgi:hypothetical protein